MNSPPIHDGTARPRRPITIKLGFLAKDAEASPSCHSEDQSNRFLDSAVRVSASPFLFDKPGELSPTLNSNIQNAVLPADESDTFFAGLPRTDYAGLREVLEEYLFGDVSKKKGLRIADRELFVLKFLLRKKFFYSHRVDFLRQIDAITPHNFAEFLQKYPQKKRTQLYKRMVFTKAWKYLTSKGIYVLGQFFGGDASFDYTSKPNTSGGNLTNEYYDRCFAVDRFKTAFLDCLNDPLFWAACRKKAVRGFRLNYERWIAMLDEHLSGRAEVEAERKMLMKIKFMSLDTDPHRVRSIFGI